MSVLRGVGCHLAAGGGRDYRTGPDPVKRAAGKTAPVIPKILDINSLRSRGGTLARPQEGLAHYAPWIPHSVFGVPAQRPARKESTETTERVQGAHPIEG